jgi:hypothetical protein
MISCVDPVSMTRLVPTCVTTTGEAYPGRRFVQIAQALGDAAFVGSVCRDDYLPAIVDMSAMLREKIGPSCSLTPLPIGKVPGDPALCRADCTLVEELPDLRHCPVGTEIDFSTDEHGGLHSLCEIPQVPTVLDDPRLGCSDPTAHLEPGPGAGWVYLPRTTGGPAVAFVGGAGQHFGSVLHFSCCLK